jgi:hypothetical protein
VHQKLQPARPNQLLLHTGGGGRVWERGPQADRQRAPAAAKGKPKGQHGGGPRPVLPAARPSHCPARAPARAPGRGLRLTLVNRCAVVLMCGPFMIWRTVTSGVKGSPGSSLGVRRKHCGVPGLNRGGTGAGGLRSGAYAMSWLLNDRVAEGDWSAEVEEACGLPLPLARPCPRTCTPPAPAGGRPCARSRGPCPG